jgi:hypothetical protein
MTDKETFYFVAKCLTISLESKNKKDIKNQLETTSINWDQVVKLSTGHYVFPALYCNLKRADFKVSSRGFGSLNGRNYKLK